MKEENEFINWLAIIKSVLPMPNKKAEIRYLQTAIYKLQKSLIFTIICKGAF